VLYRCKTIPWSFWFDFHAVSYWVGLLATAIFILAYASIASACLVVHESPAAYVRWVSHLCLALLLFALVLVQQRYTPVPDGVQLAVAASDVAVAFAGLTALRVTGVIPMWALFAMPFLFILDAIQRTVGVSDSSENKEGDYDTRKTSIDALFNETMVAKGTEFDLFAQHVGLELKATTLYCYTDLLDIELQRAPERRVEMCKNWWRTYGIESSPFRHPDSALLEVFHMGKPNLPHVEVCAVKLALQSDLRSSFDRYISLRRKSLQSKDSAPLSLLAFPPS